jgi:L1 cell adhesion molecule like protein
MDKSKYTIGIDLGTTFSCVGVWRNGKVEIIPNLLGERTTPSIVSFLNDKILIGNQAKSQIIRNYENTIYDVKRLIGRKYTDKTVEEDMKLWPFIIEKDENNNPQIIVNYKGEKRKYYPKEISAMILKQLKEDAEKYLEEEIKDVIITVPASFNNTQRYETIEAAKIAGLNVIQIINEPTAAAIAYGLQQNSENKKNICVFDFGGGTFDVTILEIDQGDFNIKTSEGDSHLGGSDIDNLLVKYCINKFKEEKDIDISLNNKALRTLKTECENVKIALSEINDINLEIDSLAEGEDFEQIITKDILNDLCNNLFEKCLQILKVTLNNPALTINEINDVVLLGGSS